MEKSEELKKVVKDKYAEIVKNNDCGCGCGCGDELEYSVFSDNYENLDGYMKDADLSLGCGLPTEYADINKGDWVLDLGSGAGNDCFVARSLVGEEGHVSGLDFVDEMLDKANKNLKKLGYTNMDFIKGDIEDMPIEDNKYDVIISNCVLNLVPDKKKAFAEMLRVLKPKGHFCVSDVVLRGELPEKVREAATLYAGCVSGAMQIEDYLQVIEDAGFENVEVKIEKPIHVPDELFLEHISQEELDAYKELRSGIFSITVVGDK